MLKDAKVLYVNKMVIFAATLHCALDDLLNQSADSWDQIRYASRVGLNLTWRD